MKTKVLALVGTALGVLLLSGGAVMASDWFRFESTLVAKGTLATPVEVSSNGIDFSTEGPTDVRTLHVAFGPSGHSGWHMHPGLVVVVVLEGSVINEIACHPGVTYGTGQSFIEPPMTAGRVSNASTTLRAVTIATLVTPKNAAPRIEAAVPNCATPADD
jgi:quercetin dioxygenase-like cupin family protein